MAFTPEKPVTSPGGQARVCAGAEEGGAAGWVLLPRLPSKEGLYP